jgi:hypothetical protein
MLTITLSIVFPLELKVDFYSWIVLECPLNLPFLDAIFHWTTLLVTSAINKQNVVNITPLGFTFQLLGKNFIHYYFWFFL